MSQLCIILDNEANLEALKAANTLQVLEALGISYAISVVSPHLHLAELDEYTKRAKDGGVKVFMAAGPALAEAVAGTSKLAVPVISVGDRTIDAPVLTASTFWYAALTAGQILAAGDRAAGLSLSSYLSKNLPEPRFDIS